MYAFCTALSSLASILRTFKIYTPEEKNPKYDLCTPFFNTNTQKTDLLHYLEPIFQKTSSTINEKYPLVLVAQLSYSEYK